MRSLGIAFASAFVLTLSLCAGLPTDPLSGWQPIGAYRVEPESMWVAQYHAAEACTGKRGNAKRVTWYIVPGKSFWDQNGANDIGLWMRGHKIYIADEWKTTAWVVRHESIHDLVGPHPADTLKNTRIWGRECQAMWGYVASDDPDYRP
jgi:hypothetical protein